MRRLRKVALALAFGLGLAHAAHAASTDTLTVTITPNAYYAVDIDTANVNLDLGVVALAASTQTVSPSTVTIQSTFATTDLKLTGAIGNPSGTAWQFDTNGTGSTELDRLATWATFTSIAHTTAPAQGGEYFSGTTPGANDSDVVDAASRYVGSSADDSTTDLFEVNNGAHGAKDMDSLPPDPSALAKSLLWLRFRLPSATTSTTAQKISIHLYAVAPN